MMRVYIEFSFNDFDLPPSSLTSTLGVCPTKIAVKDQKSPPSRRNRWILLSDESTKSIILEEHWKSISRDIYDISKFVEVSCYSNVKIDIVLFRPLVGDIIVPCNLIDFGEKLGASVGIFLYENDELEPMDRNVTCD